MKMYTLLVYVSFVVVVEKNFVHSRDSFTHVLQGCLTIAQ